MRSVNKVIIIGNLTRDPEMRQTPNGQQVSTFGIATNREWTTREGERKSSAEFHECVAWSRLAEICAQYLKKGQLVYIEGYLKTRSWDSTDGIRKFKTEIVIKDMTRLEKGQGGKDEDYTPDQDENDYQDYDYEENTKQSSQESSASEETVPEEPPSQTQPSETETEDSHVDPEPSSNNQEDPITKDLGL